MEKKEEVLKRLCREKGWKRVDLVQNLTLEMKEEKTFYYFFPYNHKGGEDAYASLLIELDKYQSEEYFIYWGSDRGLLGEALTITVFRK